MKVAEYDRESRVESIFSHNLPIPTCLNKPRYATAFFHSCSTNSAVHPAFSSPTTKLPKYSAASNPHVTPPAEITLTPAAFTPASTYLLSRVVSTTSTSDLALAHTSRRRSYAL